MAPPFILIVDDEPNQRLMLEQALRTLANDWQITTAASAPDALAAIDHQVPDLIITDYHMPTMTGLDLIAHVRERKIAARVILITAYSSPEVFDSAQRLAVDHYLTKPVKLTMLRRLTVAALKLPRPSA